MTSRIAVIVATVVVSLAILSAGVYIGTHSTKLPGSLQRLFGADNSQQVVKEATDDIKRIYYRKIPDSALADASIAGMVKSLDDRFSNYFSPTEYENFKRQTNGQFAGVGMTVTPDKKGLKVASTYPGTPARRAGLTPGDIIVAANGTPLAGKQEDVATALIKGPPGTSVTLTWLHDGKKVTKRIDRVNVSVPVVASKQLTCDGTKVGVVGLSTFSSGAHAQVYAAIKKQLGKGAKALVLDLRGNGGGLVTEAQLIVSAFVKDGPIVTTRGRDVPSHTLNATGEPVAPTTPLVVLVDNNSASASEITAGALQDRKRATLVGTRTFGKGVFQEIINLSNGGALDITAGQYFLPSGRNLGGTGVHRGSGLTPDVKTPVDDTVAKANAGLHTAVCAAAKKAA